MIVGKLFLPAGDCLAFLGAQHLLTVGRPEGLAANLADLLTEGVLSLSGKAFLFFFGLLMGFRAVGVTKPLPCAAWIKLFAALFAHTLRVLMTVIRRPAFRLCFGLMCNIPFAAFQKQYISDSIEDYIRTAQSGVVTMTADTYPVMKRIMAIYHQSGDKGSNEAIQRIADEVGMDAKTVKRYIAIGALNERRADFCLQFDEDGEETGEDVSVDTTSQPDKLYFRSVLYAALYEAYDSLTYREQRTVAKHLGFCDTCWSTKKAVLINGEIEYRPIKPMIFEEISHSASRKSDKASERTFYAAMEKMRKHIETDADYRYIFG